MWSRPSAMRSRRRASGGSPSHDSRPVSSASHVRHAQAVSRCRRGELLARAPEPPLRRGGAGRPVERARADPLPAGPGRARGHAIRHPEVSDDAGEPVPGPAHHHRGRSAGHARRPGAASLEARRAAPAHQRPARRDELRRAAARGAALRRHVRGDVPGAAGRAPGDHRSRMGRLPRRGSAAGAERERRGAVRARDPSAQARAEPGLRAAAQPRPGPSSDGAHGGGDLRMGRDERAEVMNRHGNSNGNGTTNGNGHGALHGDSAPHGNGNGANGRAHRKRGLMEAPLPLLLRRWAGPVLVVGGGGYIGTHVVEQLLAQGRRVRVLDRLLFGKVPLQDFFGNPRFELVEGDATDIFKLIEAMQGASAVVHLAGLVGDPACAVDESFTRHANVFATRLIKKAAQSLGVRRFVFASSCSVYGINPAEVSETSEVNPVSLYARTKVESERELLLDADEDFCVTTLRFATVFGHSRRPRFDLVANLFTAQAVNDGRITLMGPSQWRPFVHVRDLARAIVAVLDADPERMRGQIFNVGYRRLNMTIGQLAELVRERVSRECRVEVVEMPSKDLKNYAVSFEKIRRAIGFEAETLMEAGIEEIVAEFHKGTYGHYKDAVYSNLAMTKRALSDFRRQTAHLYEPVVEAAGLRSRDGLGNGAGPAAPHVEHVLEADPEDRLVAGLGSAVVLL